VYEDDDILAFHDIQPWAPVHFLLIPKQHVPSLAHVGPEHAGVLGRMLALAPRLAAENGARPYPQGGHRVIINRRRWRAGGAPPAPARHRRPAPLAQGLTLRAGQVPAPKSEDRWVPPTKIRAIHSGV